MDSTDMESPIHKQPVAFILVVLLVVGGALWYGLSKSGTPDHQRKEKMDHERLQRLSHLQQSVQDYYRHQKKLPDTLAESQALPKNKEVPASVYDTEEGSEHVQPTDVDPETQKPFQYINHDGKTYALCGTFDMSSREARQDDAPRYSDGHGCKGRKIQVWGGHPAGSYCFEFKADQSYRLRY